MVRLKRQVGRATPPLPCSRAHISSSLYTQNSTSPWSHGGSIVLPGCSADLSYAWNRVLNRIEGGHPNARHLPSILLCRSHIVDTVESSLVIHLMRRQNRYGLRTLLRTESRLVIVKVVLTRAHIFRLSLDRRPSTSSSRLGSSSPLHFSRLLWYCREKQAVVVLSDESGWPDLRGLEHVSSVSDGTFIACACCSIQAFPTSSHEYQNPLTEELSHVVDPRQSWGLLFVTPPAGATLHGRNDPAIIEPRARFPSHTQNIRCSLALASM
ncbi:hypothetical protein CC80DRAFT_329683 [Byssothecium circinans]|uniref:Uncharacterized protein n=1 Tax=Byssothecium circinans TaxID=147558 RepID=A0A6A5TBN8_9PLEO|nr:hypothetical protein CC80DRAFT_329683 [Byssothecium circinans]